MLLLRMLNLQGFDRFQKRLQGNGQLKLRFGVARCASAYSSISHGAQSAAEQSLSSTPEACKLSATPSGQLL
ncbi:hypothetical protein ABID21_001697 [Pseudorhizobium tarimense]|uniref:Uncharacterized protein n=1 Tax=Pseudorhizobium tarimense TaxID=1079109 RepID=A0ABV2H4X9_9HYPH